MRQFVCGAYTSLWHSSYSAMHRAHFINCTGLDGGRSVIAPPAAECTQNINGQYAKTPSHLCENPMPWCVQHSRPVPAPTPTSPPFQIWTYQPVVLPSETASGSRYRSLGEPGYTCFKALPPAPFKAPLPVRPRPFVPMASTAETVALLLTLGTVALALALCAVPAAGRRAFMCTHQRWEWETEGASAQPPPPRAEQMTLPMLPSWLPVLPILPTPYYSGSMIEYMEHITDGRLVWGRRPELVSAQLHSCDTGVRRRRLL
jgi:hypothetical protein